MDIEYVDIMTGEIFFVNLDCYYSPQLLVPQVGWEGMGKSRWVSGIIIVHVFYIQS